MFARQRLGVLDSKVQSPYTLWAILIQLVVAEVRHLPLPFGEDVQHHYPDHNEADTDQTRRT